MNFTTEQRDDIFYFVDNNNMMLTKPYYWDTNNDNHKGDALWRTSLAYIAYAHPNLKKGVLSCFKQKGDYIQAYRYPEEGYEKDVSRDQVIMALCALKINKDYTDLKKIIKNLKFKLSSKFRISLDMLLWMKALYNNNKFYTNLFIVMSFFVIFFNTLWNNILYKVTKLKNVSPEEHLKYPFTTLNNIQKKVLKIHYPKYAFHLFAWQYYTLPEVFLKKYLGKYCARIPHPSNYVLRMLFGDKVPIENISNFKPMTGFRWQENFFIGVYNTTQIIETHQAYKYITNVYNVLDKDIAYYLYNS